MKYAFGVSIIRLRGIAEEPGIAVGTALARLNPLRQGCYLRALVPQKRAIYAGKSSPRSNLIAHRNTPGAFGDPRSPD
jgi:hypothetical protein